MNNKDLNFKQHINEMMHRVRYNINETPKYTMLNPDDFKNDDVIPQKNEPSKVLNDSNINEADVTGNTNTIISTSGTTEPTPIDPNQLVPPVEEKSTNEIQNELIKNNLAIMQQLHNKINDLETYVKDLNQNVDSLNKEVEEVKEPTASEKLMSKKDVSYPYYYNLNDFWKGNWYENNRIKEEQHGIRQLPDGTYIADFDDLPKSSDLDINNSFYSRDITVQ